MALFLLCISSRLCLYNSWAPILAKCFGNFLSCLAPILAALVAAARDAKRAAVLAANRAAVRAATPNMAPMNPPLCLFLFLLRLAMVLV